MSRQFESDVIDFLVLDKAYPIGGVRTEASLGDRGGRADVAILDPARNEFVALIEIKASRDPKALRGAVSQLLQYRRALGKPHIPLYLFFPPIETSSTKFDIAQILPDGNTEEVFPNEFPAFDSLIAGDRSVVKVKKVAAAKKTVDSFMFTCITLGLLGAALVVLDVTGVLQLSAKQLVMAAVSGALFVLPFAAKFNMLGVEWERHYPKSANSD